MANYQAHIAQAKKNLAILSEINKKIPDSWDWQVTATYYIAVHLVNAHLAKTVNMHYSSHEKVKNALFNVMSPAKIDETAYLDYVKLEILSRRARYLCKDTESKDEKIREPEKTFLTFDIHLKKAIIKLDSLIEYFSTKYNEKFEITPIDCIEIKNLSLKHFKYVNQRVFVVS